jgi:RecB family endonuclease NucS
LLALDRAGHLVVIELKRTDDGGHMELQALRYAAMVSSMGYEEVEAAYAADRARAAEDDLLDPRADVLSFLGMG